MSDVSAIKNEIKKIKSMNIQDSSDLVILSALNKCFYATHKPEEEAKMVLAIQKKNGEALERISLHASAMIHE